MIVQPQGVDFGGSCLTGAAGDDGVKAAKQTSSGTERIVDGPPTLSIDQARNWVIVTPP